MYDRPLLTQSTWDIRENGAPLALSYPLKKHNRNSDVKIAAFENSFK